MVGYIEIIVIPLHTMQLALLDDTGYRDSVSKERLRHHEYLFPLKYTGETSSGEGRIWASRAVGAARRMPISNTGKSDYFYLRANSAQ